MLGNGKPANPFDAPWPPGVDCRVVKGTPLGDILQIRPGAITPAPQALKTSTASCKRAFRYGAPPCLN